MDIFKKGDIHLFLKSRMSPFQALLGWLGANIKTVRDRRLMWQELQANGLVMHGGFSAPVELIQSGDGAYVISMIRKVLGDTVYHGTIYFPHRPATEADMVRVSYFSELDAFINAPKAYSE